MEIENYVEYDELNDYNVNEDNAMTKLRYLSKSFKNN